MRLRQNHNKAILESLYNIDQVETQKNNNFWPHDDSLTIKLKEISGKRRREDDQSERLPGFR